MSLTFFRFHLALAFRLGHLTQLNPGEDFLQPLTLGPPLGSVFSSSSNLEHFPCLSHCNCFPSSVPQGPQGLARVVRSLPPLSEPHLLLADSDFFCFSSCPAPPQLRFCHSYHLLDNRDVFSFAAFSCGGPQRPALSTGDISFGHLVKMPDLFTAYSVFSLLVVMNEINEPSVGERSCNFFL